MIVGPKPIIAALLVGLTLSFVVGSLLGQENKDRAKPERKAKAAAARRRASKDAKNLVTGKATPARDPELQQYGIYAKSAPIAGPAKAIATSLPLELKKGDRIALIGNTLLDRAQHFGHFEALLHSHFPKHELVVRNLSWSADTVDLQPRPANFANLDQHLTHEKVDVIIAAFGFNESFAGKDGLADFKKALTAFLTGLKTKAYNGKSAPRILLISPIANENVTAVAAADLNNEQIQIYVDAMKNVAAKQQVGFVDVFKPLQPAMASPGTDLTINGCHLTEEGYATFGVKLFTQAFGVDEATAREYLSNSDELRAAITDRNRQFTRRYRPVNTFYYTGDRNKSYGYLDFLPAMRNFDVMTSNRDRQVWDIAEGKKAAAKVDDSNVPPLPETTESRGANRWISAADELKEFTVDPRFEVNLFAGEEEFPDIAAPIQMRWDSLGRLWVSCSTTYPHVYPGNEPDDKIVILEDTDNDGKADKSTVFADDLHIPLSFEFGDGGVYVSEQPDLTFLKDTNGDGKADVRRRVLTGFGTEDSHHSLHDITWSPDGDLIFRESIFHHSQVETPYGPVRQQNSGWFRFEPRSQRLTSFGTYHSTNPWGVTFDDWGNHVASHPIFAAAFHSLDPPYPQQHPKPAGLRAYSGTCGHEFVDFATFPEELQGGFIKARYKPTNRIEIHKWNETEFGFDEEYVSDLIFSSNLSFIPVDLRFGPRGAMYICDWYNPIKGHAQYSLRDPRRDRHSGRIWRITAKGKALTDPPKIADASIEELLDIQKRPEYRYRYWAKRELRDRDPDAVKAALDKWVAKLDSADPRHRHHQIEAVWNYRNIGKSKTALLRELLACKDHHARAAATQQLRYWHSGMPDAIHLLHRSANDANGLVRMEAAIAASYVGSKEALDAMLDVFKYPREGHTAYAITCALGSANLRRHWEGNTDYNVAKLLKRAGRGNLFKEPTPDSKGAQFDTQKNLKTVRISCIPERMRFTVDQFATKPGQPVKIVFANPDATDHNLVFVKPDALADVGMAANAMARDPKNANSDFIPAEKRSQILQASPMIGPTRKSLVHVMRFKAPTEPGVYPFVCTFPGHWVIMNGVMVVAETAEKADELLAARKPTLVKEWTMADFPAFTSKTDDESVARGMQAFVKARCNQCHAIAGHGINIGPDLTETGKRLKGVKLLEQILEPSSEINKKYQTTQFLMDNGKVLSGVVVKETETEFHIIGNLLIPTAITKVAKSQVDEQFSSKISAMPKGMANVLTRPEIIDLVSFLETGFNLPEHLKHKHMHHKK
ncbi:MAG: putative heme-binding domain-containing protein [Planctomycetaceae bacterium]|jgi:putative heme-binding domain-containing protein